MKGFCERCGKLVSITPHSQKWGTRERTYRPLMHNDCDGDRFDIRDHHQTPPPLTELLPADRISDAPEQVYEAPEQPQPETVEN